MRILSGSLKNPVIKKINILFNLLEIFLKFLFPICSILWEYFWFRKPMNPAIIAKWFIFWGVGIYFTITGISLLIRPGLMKLRSNPERALNNPELIRKTGILYLSAGVLAIIPLVNFQYLETVSFLALVYFGLSGLFNFSIKPTFRFDALRLMTDLMIFSSSLLFLFYTIFSN